MNVKRVEDLREIANETLSGLEAGPALRHRIVSAQAPAAKRKLPVRGLAIALSCALVLAVVIPVALNGQKGVIPSQGDPAKASETPKIQSFSAGGDGVHNETASLNGAQVTVTNRNKDNKYSLWDESGLIRWDGRYYRLIRETRPNGNAVGSIVATVSAQVSDPTLSGEAVVSKDMPVSTEIYSLSGISEKSLIVCYGSDGLRLYQRISLAGNGLLGSERFADVMPDASRVTAISLTGQDVIEGDEARRLYGILIRGASPEGNGSITAERVLIITLDNGAAIQLSVKGNRIGGCGVWSCPDFFEAFNP